MYILSFSVCLFVQYVGPAPMKKKKSKGGKRKSAFDSELTSTGRSALKKFRSG